MCEIYASTDPELYSCRTRSVRLNGYATSLRLENRFWQILDELAAAEGSSTPAFLGKLYNEVLHRRGEVSNFASMLRVVCTVYLEQQAGVGAPQLARGIRGGAAATGENRGSAVAAVLQRMPFSS